jgi:hypothetical protein
MHRPRGRRDGNARQAPSLLRPSLVSGHPGRHQSGPVSSTGPFGTDHDMTQFEEGWGAGPGSRYDELAARFRPAFLAIAAGAVEREADRRYGFRPKMAAWAPPLANCQASWSNWRPRIRMS